MMISLKSMLTGVRKKEETEWMFKKIIFSETKKEFFPIFLFNEQKYNDSRGFSSNWFLI